MALSMPSRFACLKIEGDDLSLKDTTNKTNPKINKKVDAKPQPPKKAAEKGAKKTSAKTPNPAPQVKKEKKKKEQTKQWEEWKQRDNDMVDGYFEKDLQSAIMMSKLEFEKNKQQQTTQASKIDLENGLKKKKNKIMSLEQFNTMMSGPKTTQSNTSNANSKLPPEEDEHFFETIESDAKRELSKDQKLEKRKARNENIEEIITLAQCQVQFS